VTFDARRGWLASGKATRADGVLIATFDLEDGYSAFASGATDRCARYHKSCWRCNMIERQTTWRVVSVFERCDQISRGSE
jgi:hypothetical protein